MGNDDGYDDYAASISSLRKPPQSLEAEHAVIGGLLIAGNMFDEVREVMCADDFYHHQHRIIFSAIEALHSDHKPIDLITVSEYLEQRRELEIAGGLAYLAELAHGTPSVANVVAYGRIVADRATDRRLIAVAHEIANNGFQSELTTDEKIDMAESVIMTVRRDEALDTVEPVDIVRSVVAEMEKQFSHKGEVYGLPTGFADLDRRYHGWRGGDLIILAGRPSMGKSTFAQNIAEHSAFRSEKAVLFFSLEMSKEDVVKRMISSQAHIPFEKIRTASILGENGDAFSMAATRIARSRLFIDDRAALTLSQVRAKARRIKRRHKDLALIVVDYLQLMTGKAETREREVAMISAGLKQLAKEIDVPVLALSQLSRGLEQRGDKRPMMSDLRESGAIEQDADIIMFIYRDEVYHEDTDEKGVAHIITRKFRNGQIGTDYLTTKFETMQFVNTTYTPKAGKKYGIRTGGTFNYED